MTNGRGSTSAVVVFVPDREFRSLKSSAKNRLPSVPRAGRGPCIHTEERRTGDAEEKNRAAKYRNTGTNASSTACACQPRRKAQPPAKLTTESASGHNRQFTGGIRDDALLASGDCSRMATRRLAANFCRECSTARTFRRCLAQSLPKCPRVWRVATDAPTGWQLWYPISW